MEITLRPYQQECIDAIEQHESGAYLVQMATGLGKTVTFSRIPRSGRMLILSHREELVKQPLKYFDCLTGIEMAGSHASEAAEVVSASVPSLVRRLRRFSPDAFDTIICDEAHHAAANTYRKIFNHFRPRLLLGFTATPKRGDNVRLDDVFEDIIFERDLRWGIENGYLSDIYCRRVNIGYDLSDVSTRHGDYAPGELDTAMEGTADAIAEVYGKMASGATLIFAVSVNHAHEIAERIPGAVAVTGETKNRSDIIRRFTNREIPCLVNCMVFTEGTDMPLIETIIMARPTKSDSLYTQMVGRGLRKHPDKQVLNLIDCVDASGSASLCTAPSLMGIDLESVPPTKRYAVEGMLFDLPAIALEQADCPESWIRNVQIVDLFAKRNHYDLHGVNWFLQPDGSLSLSVPGQRLTIPPCDDLGRTKTKNGELMPMQQALDVAYAWLSAYRNDAKQIWNLTAVKRWGAQPASEKQIDLINRRMRGWACPAEMTKGEASMILNRLIGR